MQSTIENTEKYKKDEKKMVVKGIKSQNNISFIFKKSD